MIQPGCVYTPMSVARLMAASAQRAVREKEASTNGPLSVLDPACGDGALLAAMRESWPNAGASWHGVDLDAEAILRASTRLGGNGTFVVGDALTGPPFVDESPEGWLANGIAWGEVFPDVACKGGFDLVIANPPYIRERGAKARFDEIAATPLGQRWRRPRMDLWHYFFHRGLDLLAPGGVFTLIVPSYFATATSAAPIRKRLLRETRLVELIDLDRLPVFPGVQGRHLILTLCHETPVTTASVRVAWPLGSEIPPEQTDAATQQIVSDPFDPTAAGDPIWARAVSSQTDVVTETRLALRPASHRSLRDVSPHHSINGNGRTLGDLFQVRQGIAENPPRLTAAHARELGEPFREGQGVFVLSAEEVAALEPSPLERDLLRPYYAAGDIGRYTLTESPAHWLLYLTRDTCPDLAAMPAIQRHLQRFKTLLGRRREARLGKIAWWHLHWPRRETLFTQPRILAPQMVRSPMFHCVHDRPTFVNFSVNLVVCPETDGPRRLLAETTGLDDAVTILLAACGWLNSSRAAAWFAAHAKHRGAALDISGGTLRQLPWPSLSTDGWRRLVELATARTQTEIGTAEAAQLDSAIDELFGT